MKYVTYSVGDRIGFITLNRPDKRNALNHQVIQEMNEAFQKAEEDDHVKVIVLNANGEVFCAGADLNYLQQLQNFSYEENLADSSQLKSLMLKIYTLSKVVIAQVQGHALAGGCGLVSVCDFILTVPEAKFGYTEVKIGFIPAIVMVFLLRKIGEAKAKQLLLRGDLISAEEAAAMGLVSEVVAIGDLERKVQELALRLIQTNSAEAMKLTKQMIATVPSMPLADSLSFAARMNAEARATEDCKRGIAAFLNKENISW